MGLGALIGGNTVVHSGLDGLVGENKVVHSVVGGLIDGNNIVHYCQALTLSDENKIVRSENDYPNYLTKFSKIKDSFFYHFVSF